MELRPGYKQTEVGVIPEDWSNIEIGGSIDLLTGFPFPSNGYSKSGVRLLRGSNVKRGVTDWSEEGTEYWPEVKPEIRKYILRSGDIVIAMDGSLVGRSFAMLSESDVPAVLLQRVARIRSNTIHQKFLKAWICSQRFTEHCDAVKTVTAIPHISPADIRSFPIALPPTKAEQEAIAEALSGTDALIESLEQLIAKKRHLKQGAMQELLTGKKRLPGFSGEWEVKQLGDLCEKITTGKLDANAMKESGEYPFFTCAKEHYWIDKYAFDTEALLVSGNGANVGYVHYYEGKFNAYQRTYVLSGFSCDIQFVKLFMERNLQERIRVEVNAGNTPYIVMGTLTDMLVTLPAKLSEQTAIATILSDMDAEITTLETKLAKTRQLKQGMMHNLLTGKIRLNHDSLD